MRRKTMARDPLASLPHPARRSRRAPSVQPALREALLKPRARRSHGLLGWLRSALHQLAG